MLRIALFVPSFFRECALPCIGSPAIRVTIFGDSADDTIGVFCDAEQD
jgi:hypothetical protein